MPDSAFEIFIQMGRFEQHDILIGFDSMNPAIGGIRIPIVSVDLNGAFIVTALLFLTGVVIIRRWQQKPKVADLLIDTESELRKVTWPTMDEVTNSSLVVIVCVVIIGAFLAGADYFLGELMRRLILGG